MLLLLSTIPTFLQHQLPNTNTVGANTPRPNTLYLQQHIISMHKGFKSSRTITSHAIPSLIIIFSYSLPLLHYNKSRIYNYQVAVVELVILIFSFLVYKKKLLNHFLSPSREKILVILFLFAALISAIHSDYTRYSLQRDIAMSIWFLYFWLTVFLIKEKLLTEHAIFIIFSTSTIIPICVFSYYYFTLPPQSFEGIFKHHYYFYSNVRHFGYHLTAAAIAGLYFIITSKGKKVTLAFGLFICLLNITVLIWTASRQGILIAGTTCFVSLNIYYKEHRKKLFIAFIIATALSLIVLDILGITEKSINRIYSSTFNIDSLYDLTSGRILVWKETLSFIRNNWVLGSGSESFYYLYGNRQSFRLVQPHSIILQSLLSWGIVGSMFFFTILWITFYYPIKYLRNYGIRDNEHILIATALLSAILANSLIDGTLYHVLPIYIFSFMAAIVCANACNNT